MSIIASGTTSGTALVSTGDTNGNLVFQTNGTTTALTLSTAQLATFAGKASFPSTIGVGGATAAASGSGVSFPATQSASSDVNTLDDYEEGTWTAAITCGTSGTITLDPSYNTLRYTKVGRVVALTGFIYVSAVSSPVGTVTVTGLPFVNGAANGNVTGVSVYIYGLNTASNLMIGIDKSSSSINTRTFSAGAVTTSIAGYFFATSGFYLNLTYFID
jgi:hypothetical protein